MLQHREWSVALFLRHQTLAQLQLAPRLKYLDAEISHWIIKFGSGNEWCDSMSIVYLYPEARVDYVASDQLTEWPYLESYLWFGLSRQRLLHHGFDQCFYFKLKWDLLFVTPPMRHRNRNQHSVPFAAIGWSPVNRFSGHPTWWHSVYTPLVDWQNIQFCSYTNNFSIEKLRICTL